VNAFVAIACDELQKMKLEANRDSLPAPALVGGRRIPTRGGLETHMGGSRKRRVGRRRRQEVKRRGSRVVERRSKTIRRKTFKTQTSSSDTSSPELSSSCDEFFVSLKVN